MRNFLMGSLLLGASLTTSTLRSQAQALHGVVQVLDSATERPVPYASAGIKGKALGTIATAAGTFPLAQLSGAAATDTAVVSCVGYVPRRLVVGRLGAAAVVRLVPQAQRLAEVVVRGTQLRPVVLGYRGVSAFTSYSFYTQTDTVAHARLGREFGTLLHVRRPTQLRELHLFTFGSDFKQVTFRLNVYTVRNGQPQESLLAKDVLFTVDGGQRRWTTVDLQPYTIELAGPQDVAATVQWVGSEQRRPGGRFFSIPAHLSATHTSFMRDKSAQVWRKFRVNPSLYFVGLQDGE